MTRYAVLIQEKSEGGGLFSFGGVEPEKKVRVAYLIKSSDNGETWEYVDSRSESDALKVMRALNKTEEEAACAAFRYQLEGNDGNVGS